LLSAVLRGGLEETRCHDVHRHPKNVADLPSHAREIDQRCVWGEFYEKVDVAGRRVLATRNGAEDARVPGA
jgi:hypothetical protein